MATKRETIKLATDTLPSQDEYIMLVAEKKRIEERLEQLKEIYKSALTKVWVPEKNFLIGRINVGARQSLELDQMACLKAFETKKKRELLFPTAIKFAAADNKDLVVDEGLGQYQYGGMVFTIK